MKLVLTLTPRWLERGDHVIALVIYFDESLSGASMGDVYHLLESWVMRDTLYPLSVTCYFVRWVT